MKVKLSKLFKYEGQDFTELNIDFEGLTTADYEQAEREFKSLNSSTAVVSMIESETGFIKIVLCKALGKTHDFLDKLPITDFVKLKVATQSFLLTGSMALLDGSELAV